MLTPGRDSEDAKTDPVWSRPNCEGRHSPIVTGVQSSSGPGWASPGKRRVVGRTARTWQIPTDESSKGPLAQQLPASLERSTERDKQLVGDDAAAQGYWTQPGTRS
jgi:hypothetical protein